MDADVHKIQHVSPSRFRQSYHKRIIRITSIQVKKIGGLRKDTLTAG
jgi:hypothetical protein